MKKYIFLLFTLNLALAFDLDSKKTNVDSIKKAHIEKSGFFIGVHAGVSVYGARLYNASGQNVAWGSSVNSAFETMGGQNIARANVGVKLGYSHFFTSHFGLRGYLNYDWSDYRDLLVDSKIASEETSIMLDFLANVWNAKNISLGLFVGFGCGYNLPQFSVAERRSSLESSFKYNGFIMPISAGAYISFISHKIELGTRIPTLLGRYKSNVDSSGFGLSPLIISVGYSYIF